MKVNSQGRASSHQPILEGLLFLCPEHFTSPNPSPVQYLEAEITSARLTTQALTILIKNSIYTVTPWLLPEVLRHFQLLNLLLRITERSMKTHIKLFSGNSPTKINWPLLKRTIRTNENYHLQ